MTTKSLNASRRSAPLLGLSLGDHQIGVALVKRLNGRTETTEAFTVELSWETLMRDPESAGASLRQRLDQSGIQTKRCVVALPLAWVLSSQVELPDLSSEDLRTFLELRAERDFPVASGELVISHSRHSGAGGKSAATLVAIAAKRFEAVQRLLRSAGCVPVSISLGLNNPLNGTDAQSGLLQFWTGDRRIDLAVLNGGGVVSLRSLEVPESAETNSDTARTFAREFRLTLGRLPEAWRRELKKVCFLGAPAAVARLRAALQALLAADGIEEVLAGSSESTQPLVCTLAEQAAQQRLLERPVFFEFLAPKDSRWQQWMERFGAKRNRWMIGAPVGLILLIVLVTGWHMRRLSRLETEWDSMRERVEALDQLQQKIRSYRPWFEASALSLQIARSLTQAFPEEGSVWAKTVEIKDNARVYCTGFANSNQALFDTLDRLRTEEAVSDVQVQQVRGQRPIQFAFNFKWDK